MGGELELSRQMTTTALARALVTTDGCEDLLRGLMDDGLVNQNGSLSSGVLSTGGKLKRDELALRVVMFNYEFRRHSQNQTLFFYKRRSDDVFTQFVKDSSLIRDIVARTYRILYKMSPSSEVNATVANITNNITESADMSAGIIKVGDHLYWFPKDGILKEELGSNDECYYVLFNSPKSKEEPEITITRDDSNDIMGYYFDTWNMLRKYVDNDTPFGVFYKDLPMEFDFIFPWANTKISGYENRYWDILLSFVPNFLYIKPKATYFLLGNTRGGKSSYVKLLHYIMGKNNTSNVRLNELSDSHKNLTITSTIMNAPDEEIEGKLSDQDMANYKTISTHDDLSLNVMYSQVPQKVTTDFMMYIPSNGLPDFHGQGAAACIKRAKVINFLSDLSENDNKQISFLGDIITKPILCRLLGYVFALAKYFSAHDFWYSPAMDASKDFVSETANSSTLYIERWKKHFDGYERWNDVWEDYKYWCKANNCQWEEAKALKMRFDAYSVAGRIKAKAPDGKWRNVYRIPENKTVMFHDLKISNYLGTVEDIHDGKADTNGSRRGGQNSVVDILDKLAEEEMDKSIFRQAALKAKKMGEL